MNTTEEEVRARTVELINDLPNWLPEKLDSLLRSGAVDPESYPVGYQLPKLIMCALAREIERQFKPYSDDKKMKSEIFNLYINI
jgi:hypothetical protein